MDLRTPLIPRITAPLLTPAAARLPVEIHQMVLTHVDDVASLQRISLVNRNMQQLALHRQLPLLASRALCVAAAAQANEAAGEAPLRAHLAQLALPLAVRDVARWQDDEHGFFGRILRQHGLSQPVMAPLMARALTAAHPLFEGLLEARAQSVVFAEEIRMSNDADWFSTGEQTVDWLQDLLAKLRGHGAILRKAVADAADLPLPFLLRTDDAAQTYWDMCSAVDAALRRAVDLLDADNLRSYLQQHQAITDVEQWLNSANPTTAERQRVQRARVLALARDAIFQAFCSGRLLAYDVLRASEPLAVSRLCVACLVLQHISSEHLAALDLFLTIVGDNERKRIAYEASCSHKLLLDAAENAELGSYVANVFDGHWLRDQMLILLSIYQSCLSGRGEVTWEQASNIFAQHHFDRVSAQGDLAVQPSAWMSTEMLAELWSLHNVDYRNHLFAGAQASAADLEFANLFLDSAECGYVFATMESAAGFLTR